MRLAQQFFFSLRSKWVFWAIPVYRWLIYAELVDQQTGLR